MKSVLEFIAQHPVFTRKEFVSFLVNHGTTNPKSQTALLQYHLKQRHIIRIRQGLFATIPSGADGDAYPVDPYLIAGKSAPDAVLSYHTALEYHGLAYTIFNNFTFCTNMRLKPFFFHDNIFEATAFPAALRKSKNELFAVDAVKRQGLTIKLSSLERTFVDLLDQPNRSGGWEEIYRSIENIALLDLDMVIDYVLLLEKATTVARVGYFMEKLHDKLGIAESYLKTLEKHIPKNPHYLDRARRKDGKFFKRWNLIVPEKIVNQQWEEPIYEN